MTFAGISSTASVMRLQPKQSGSRDPGCGPRPCRLHDAERVLGKPIEREYNLFELLRRPDVSYDKLMTLPGAPEPIADIQAIEQVEIQAKYQGYIDRQQDEVERNLEAESLRLPYDIDYASVRGLSKEVQQKLNQHKPETVGQAARIQGVTPAAISLLLVHLKRGSLAASQIESPATRKTA